MLAATLKTRTTHAKDKLSVRAIGVLCLCILVTSACAPSTSPPGPNTLSGTVGNAGYSLHRWDQGISVLIIHDAPAALFCEGSGSSSSQQYILECQSDSDGDASFSWVIRSKNGKNAEIAINNMNYEIGGDSLFLVRSSDKPPGIEKIDRDLSGVDFEHEAVLELAEIDPEIQNFVTSIG